MKIGGIIYYDQTDIDTMFKKTGYLPDDKKTTNHVQGFGYQLTPVKKHVLVYFQQKELSMRTEAEFYQHYHKRNWLNLKGNLLKKLENVRWQWIWNK